MFGLAHGCARIQHFGKFVFAAIVAEPAATPLFIKEIRRKRNGIADSPADYVTNRFADGFADDVEACDFAGRRNPQPIDSFADTD